MTTRLQLQQANSNLLERALQIDGTLCATSGAACLVWARPLAGFFGLNAPMVFTSLGAVILIYGVALLLLPGRAAPARALVQIAAGLNIIWIVVSVVGLLAGWFPISSGGKWAVAIMADIVLVITAVQIYALRRSG
jgi:hypothetical protein